MGKLIAGLIGAGLGAVLLALPVIAIDAPGPEVPDQCQVSAKDERRQKGSDNRPAQTAARARTMVKLRPEREAEVINFDDARGIQLLDLVILSNRRIPHSIRPKDITVGAPRRFARVSGTLESTHLPRPKAYRTRISPNRREITTSVCFRGHGVSAGTYTGQLRVGGPRGIVPASIATTVNFKARMAVFAAALLVALAVAALLLWFREYTSNSRGKPGWTYALSILVPLATAATAMIAIYAQDPAWGADVLTAGLSLIGTGLAAAGVKELFSSRPD